MPNSSFINKDFIIEQVYEGKQTFETVTKLAAKMMVLADKLLAQKKPVKILISIKGITGVSADALLAAADALSTVSKSKVAVWGGNKFLDDISNLVIAAVGREESVLVFDTKKEALEWLKSSK